MRNGFVKTVWGSLLVSLLFLVGCAQDEFDAHIKGEVLINDKLVEMGSISFIPVDGQSPTMGGEIIEGKYESPCPIGESLVEIRVPRKTGSRKLYDTPNSPVQDTFEEVLPAKYNAKTQLRFTAQPGMNEKSWTFTVPEKK